MTDIEKFMDHSGVKGMKWGVRRSKSSKSSGKEKTSYKKAPKKLSEAELNRRIKRMELEKKYNDLNSPPPSAGKQYARGILERSGQSVATAAVGGAATFLVQRELRRRFGS